MGGALWVPLAPGCSPRRTAEVTGTCQDAQSPDQIISPQPQGLWSRPPPPPGSTSARLCRCGRWPPCAWPPEREASWAPVGRFLFSFPPFRLPGDQTFTPQASGLQDHSFSKRNDISGGRVASYARCVCVCDRPLGGFRPSSPLEFPHLHSGLRRVGDWHCQATCLFWGVGICLLRCPILAEMRSHAL